MVRKRRGFTLIEVAIFLAITGALFVSIAVGVQNSVYQQRTNDAVQNFVEFLRTNYAEVSNVQNTSGGRSEKAIYGKLITFGESRDLAGEEIGEENAIFVYTVIGDIDESKSGGALELLHSLNANVVRRVDKDGEQVMELAGIAERYTPKWAATIEPSCGDSTVENCEYVPMQGTLLIVKHPRSGEVYSYYSPEVIQVNEIIKNANYNGTDASIFNKSDEGSYLTSSDFELGDIDFCINTTGEEGVRNRADVRIIAGAKNASGIEIIPSDVGDYKCGK